MSNFNKTSAPSRYKRLPINVKSIEAVKIVKAADRVVCAAAVIRHAQYNKPAIADRVKVTTKEQAISRLFI